jgi:hypothetical protein
MNAPLRVPTNTRTLLILTPSPRDTGGLIVSTDEEVEFRHFYTK